MGGTFDGSSCELDEDINERSAKVLSYLQKRNVSEALQWATRGLGRFQAEEVLYSFLLEYENGGRISRKFMEGETTFEDVLRDMQNNREPTRPPLRPKSLEQYARKHSNFMFVLSHIVASQGKTPWSNPLWESGISRTTNGTPFRAHRIKALGNGVVPLQVKIAFERLIGRGHTFL